MLDLVKSGGWLMAPILLCSVAAMGIVAERLWSLRRERVAPPDLAARVHRWARRGELTEERLRALSEGSALGRILASGLASRGLDRDRVRERIEEVGRHAVHGLGRHLNALGTIAAIAPLLGLLGTVIGMIKVFAVVTAQGVGEPRMLAGGISEALITTAAGLTVAIPSLLFHRYLRGRVDDLAMAMERDAVRLMDLIEDLRADRPGAGSAP